MSCEISTISNEKLKKAAEKADLGNNKFSYNGKLDSSEIIVFIQEAEKLDCNIAEVNGLISTIKVRKTDTLENKLKLYNEINTAKNNIKDLKNKSGKIPVNNTKTIGTFVGGACGIATGFLAASLLSGIMTVPTILALGIVGMGATFGGFVGHDIGENLANHEEKCNEKEKENIEKQIKAEEKRLEELKKDFLSKI